MKTPTVPLHSSVSRRLRTLAWATLATAAAWPLLAQQPATTSASGDEAIQLPALEVRATLRSEPVLSVPIAVAVISGDQLLRANLNDLSDITASMPSLTFRSGASNKDTSLLIRGVGTITTSPGTEPDVSTVVDGVVLARPGQATMDLVDVDHIEVLRGPQGTLFGKNSSVGVVNVVTKDPTNQTRGYLDTSFYDDNEEVVHAGISGAILPDHLLASVSFLYDRFAGNVDNVFLNKKVNGYENYGARTKFVYTPTPLLKTTLILNLIKSHATVPNDGPVVAASTTAFPSGITTPNAVVPTILAPVVPGPDNTRVNSGILGQTHDLNDGASVQFDYTLSDYLITAITAYQHWDNNQFQDTGLVPAPTVGQTLSWDDGYVWFDQYSQELRLTSPAGKFFTYVTGIYFQRAIDTETYTRNIVQEPAAGTLVPNVGQAHYGTHSNNYSMYGEGVLHFTSRLRGIVGLRLTEDTLNFYHQRISSSAVAVPGIQPTLPVHSGDTTKEGLSGRTGVQYDLTSGLMTYATYARGYKGPAYNVFFNQTALQVGALNPETSDDYEVGLKGLTFHNRLQFTVTGFDTIYHNYQANFQTVVVGTPVTNLINAGQVSSKGVEMDARARVTSGLTLSASLSRINARIDSFNTPAGATNVNGQPLPFAPKFKSNAQAEYTIPLENGLSFNATTNYSWQTREQFQLTETPDTIQGAYGLWNASFSIGNPKDGWRVSLLLKNLRNTHYAAYLAQGSGFDWRIVPRDNDRYIGINLHQDF